MMMKITAAAVTMITAVPVMIIKIMVIKIFMVMITTEDDCWSNNDGGVSDDNCLWKNELIL